MNTPIKFEIAKLLKEKGFMNGIHYDGVGGYFTNTTIAEVIMWLYERHRIWIWVEKQYNPIYFRPVIDCTTPTSKTHRPGFSRLLTMSPTEAYIAAIQWTLNNLII